MFLPKNHFSQGAGFSNLEYGLMAELLGKSKLASEVSVLSFHGDGALGVVC
jgi:acyl-CoA dehydrogenase